MTASGRNLFKDWEYQSDAEFSADEARMDVIGQNGNEGLHYEDMWVTKYDDVTLPKHYQLHDNYEVKDLMADVMAKFTESKFAGNPDLYYPYLNAIKYTLRWPFKGETKEECLKDLRKAIECLEDVKRNIE